MTQLELLKFGFKKKKDHINFWFELNIGHHKFLTNDNLYNKGVNKWHIGYYNKKNSEDTFWFNNKLIDSDTI